MQPCWKVVDSFNGAEEPGRWADRDAAQKAADQATRMRRRAHPMSSNCTLQGCYMVVPAAAEWAWDERVQEWGWE